MVAESFQRFSPYNSKNIRLVESGISDFLFTIRIPLRCKHENVGYMKQNSGSHLQSMRVNRLNRVNEVMGSVELKSMI